jgi:hypothetical protein
MANKQTNGDMVLYSEMPHEWNDSEVQSECSSEIPVYGVVDFSCDDMHLAMCKLHCRFQYNT